MQTRVQYSSRLNNAFPSMNIFTDKRLDQFDMYVIGKFIPFKLKEKLFQDSLILLYKTNS